MASSKVDPARAGYIFVTKTASFSVYSNPALNVTATVKEDRYLIETLDHVTLFHGKILHQNELEHLNTIFTRGL